MGGMVIRVATVTIFDGDRALNINRGTFVEAPPEFFKRYDSKDLVAPSRPFDPKSDFKMTIPTWYGMPVPQEPAKPEPAPKPAPKPEPEKPLETAGKDADEGLEKEAPGAMTSKDIATKGKIKRKVR